MPIFNLPNGRLLDEHQPTSPDVSRNSQIIAIKCINLDGLHYSVVWKSNSSDFRVSDLVRFHMIPPSNTLPRFPNRMLYAAPAASYVGIKTKQNPTEMNIPASSDTVT